MGKKHKQKITITGTEIDELTGHPNNYTRTIKCIHCSKTLVQQVLSWRKIPPLKRWCARCRELTEFRERARHYIERNRYGKKRGVL